MKNPKWTREEIILTLNFYFQSYPSIPEKDSKEIKNLSFILKSLQQNNNKEKNINYRNENGVHMKLMNFHHLNPDYKGKGLKAVSKMDREIFNEFYKNRKELKKSADKIIKDLDLNALEDPKLKRVQKKMPNFLVNLIKNCDADLEKIYEGPFNSSLSGSGGEDWIHEWNSSEYLRQQPITLLHRLIGLSLNIFKVDLKEERLVLDAVSKLNDDFHPNHKAFIALLINHNSSTANIFWNALSSAALSNSNIHNPFSVKDIIDIDKSIAKNEKLKAKFREFVLNNRILPQSSNRHIELEDSLNASDAIGGACAVVFEDEELQKKIIEKYKKSVFQGYLLIHGINPFKGIGAYADETNFELDSIQLNFLAKGKYIKPETSPIYKERYEEILTMLGKREFPQNKDEVGIPNSSWNGAEEILDHSEQLDRAIRETKELVLMLKSLNQRGKSFRDAESISEHEQIEWQATISLEDSLELEIKKNWRHGRALENLKIEKNEFGNNLSSLYLNSLSYLLKSLQSRRAMQSITQFEKLKIDHETMARVVDAKNLRSVSNYFRDKKIKKITASRQENSWILEETKTSIGKSRAFHKDFYVMDWKNARDWASKVFTFSPKKDSEFIFGKRIGYRELVFYVDLDQELTTEDLEWLFSKFMIFRKSKTASVAFANEVAFTIDCYIDDISNNQDITEYFNDYGLENTDESINDELPDFSPYWIGASNINTIDTIHYFSEILTKEN